MADSRPLAAMKEDEKYLIPWEFRTQLAQRISEDVRKLRVAFKKAQEEALESAEPSDIVLDRNAVDGVVCEAAVETFVEELRELGFEVNDDDYDLLCARANR